MRRKRRQFQMRGRQVKKTLDFTAMQQEAIELFAYRFRLSPKLTQTV
jgi:hypothetical protein